MRRRVLVNILPAKYWLVKCVHNRRLNYKFQFWRAFIWDVYETLSSIVSRLCCSHVLEPNSKNRILCFCILFNGFSSFHLILVKYSVNFVFFILLFLLFFIKNLLWFSIYQGYFICIHNVMYASQMHEIYFSLSGSCNKCK